MNFSKLDGLLNRIKALGQKEICVGVIAKTASRKDQKARFSNAQIAAVHEFGAPNKGIPARPFLRSTLIRNKQVYTEALATQMRKSVKQRQSAEQAYQAVGLKAASDVQHEIRHGAHTPLKTTTIQRKKSSQPLIDIGQLHQSITSIVRDINES
ncbi:Uncharacterized protein MCB1EB_0423 [Mycoavidus cysteinexigens]|uniref:Uncharacterized protein n=1 Tax=Mycoavidus cysteinexigens TaxID=1553431 RepID=A0A2Z6ET44_9BURK|nr:hypothetical protein [Mycoavidus cysteinexigens]BBE08584.1 Uncharacterized protein MCB1EB_0423 [Mycoavidus cysteinexigens]GAM52712.1 phage-related protein [bacterium endosymbiont of Mortierella elongata FMR23-6]GLR02364.1 hypothetical protein GCM10007934_21810 [Mycoavidus cysteinexigens]